MLYHREVFWPAQLDKLAPKGCIPLVYTNHAQNAARNDKYGAISLPNFIKSQECNFFECEIENGSIKFALRMNYNDRCDIILVILKGRSGWTVKTVWLNLKSDNHKTLAKKAYATA